MSAELPGWDFEATVESARKAWNSELSKAKVTTSDSEARTIFYTALYHTMIMPSTFSDVDDPSTEYTTFSLWDTYRAQMPLMTILHPDRENDMVASMLKIYQKQGRLPVWHLVGNETDCMVGNPGVIAVADAVVKGFDGFDKDLAWEAMKTTMMDTIRGLNYRQKYGYIPSEKMFESIAFDMEYAIADAAVASAADYLGKAEDSEYFRNRSYSYRNYMDSTTLFARGLRSTHIPQNIAPTTTARGTLGNIPGLRLTTIPALWTSMDHARSSWRDWILCSTLIPGLTVRTLPLTSLV